MAEISPPRRATTDGLAALGLFGVGASALALGRMGWLVPTAAGFALLAWRGWRAAASQRHSARELERTVSGLRIELERADLELDRARESAIELGRRGSELVWAVGRELLDRLAAGDARVLRADLSELFELAKLETNERAPRSEPFDRDALLAFSEGPAFPDTREITGRWLGDVPEHLVGDLALLHRGLALLAASVDDVAAPGPLALEIEARSVRDSEANVRFSIRAALAEREQVANVGTRLRLAHADLIAERLDGERGFDIDDTHVVAWLETPICVDEKSGH